MAFINGFDGLTATRNNHDQEIESPHKHCKDKIMLQQLEINELRLKAEITSNASLQKTITDLNSKLQTEIIKQSNILKSHELKIKELNFHHEEAMKFLEEKLQEERDR